MDDMDMESVYSAWRRFKEEGHGYLERTVHATAEHYVKVTNFTVWIYCIPRVFFLARVVDTPKVR